MQLEKQEEKERQEQYKKAMQQEKESVKIRHDQNFLINVVKEIQKEVAGEEDTIISEIIVANTRLVKDAAPESKNLFLSDTTGVGKDYTTKKTLEVLIPKKDLLHVTKMSNESFTYWHANEENWNWDTKVIHLEDITESLLNGSTFKVMASGGSHAIVVREQKTIEIPINGKPCMIITSHHASPEDESLRRFPIGSHDNSLNQTIKIKDKISRRFTGREQVIPDPILRSTVQQLRPHSVLIPYAELIQYFFPDDVLMRTHYRRFLDYICSSAVFHQYQREKNKDGRLIATPDDYMIARMVLIYTTSNPLMISLSKEYRDLLKILQEHIDPMTIRELGLNFDKSPDWLYKNLPRLVETKLIKKGKKFDDNANKEVITYQYAPEQNPNAIPTWNEIQKKIEKIINKTKKTTKTTPESLLERWFYDNEIKPIKPKNGGFSLVLFGLIIPFNREVLLVFAVLGSFLRERDEKRYRRYYEERESSLESTTIVDFTETTENKPLTDKIMEVKTYIDQVKIRGHNGISYATLIDHFDEKFISNLIQSGQLIKLPKGNIYDWGTRP